ncbi:MAG: recombinase family protein [Pseudomonadota bacterium]|nr:recombinase family protein [Pseudomonadota bacterium]
MATRVRCAIYTRKSTEDGLEQAFNSLDAQREACAAFILSQKHEGWTLVPYLYDDGGFSGGSMERPALQRLLADVEAGRVDVIVVYKVDRLTRSLADFAKIVAVLDGKGASFVSVTQAFNTTTSMGRLTLNVLLSFAQFEREVTGERIRDKIAASKKKGLWMGGPVPLGYEVRERKLVVNPVEAAAVRDIMQRYLKTASANVLIEELEQAGIRTKVQHRVSGPRRGGIPFRRGSLYHLLKNPVYRGFIVHKGNTYPGEHEAIVDEELWTAVQDKLAGNAAARKTKVNMRHNALLAGLLFDAENRPMVFSHTAKGQVRYRYYASRREPDDKRPATRVTAETIEQVVLTATCEWLRAAPNHQASANVNELVDALSDDSRRRDALRRIVDSITMGDDRLALRLCQPTLEEINNPDEHRDDIISEVTVPFRPERWVRDRRDVYGAAPAASPDRNTHALLKLVRKAFDAQNLVLEKPGTSLAAIAASHKMDRRQLGRLVKLSWLSPSIIERIHAGDVPRSLTRSRLLEADLPLDWDEQERALGFC